MQIQKPILSENVEKCRIKIFRQKIKQFCKTFGDFCFKCYDVLIMKFM